MARMMIFTGKGGVGKTSVAAAHAVRSAREGCRTLLVSADMAHNLGDVFQTTVGGTAKEVQQNLWLLELDPYRLMRQEFPNVSQALGDLLAGVGFAAGAADGSFPIPGFDTLFSLLKIGKLFESGEYERILVDCAPTGETLSLLKFPELLAWYMEKFYPVGKFAVRVMAPAARAKYRVKLPGRKAMNEVERLHQSLLALQELLKDGSSCSVRLVCMPEKMVVEETKRSFMHLSLYGYQVDGVYINRVLGEMPDNPFLMRWREIQQQYLDELGRVFVGYPVMRLPWYPEEVRGMAAVERLSAALPESPELFAVRVHSENETYEVVDGGYRLRLRLPGAAGEVTAECRGTDLYIRVQNTVRCIPLPDVLRGAAAVEYGLADGVLCVAFRMRDAEGEGEPQ